jgi:peroxiredoxin
VKVLKLFLVAYQAAIVIISALFILQVFRALFDTSPCTVYHWDYIIKVSFIVVPSFVFCLCNVLRLSLPKWSLFESWKSLGSISIVFAVLWTCLFGYIRILQAGYVSGGASLANIIAPEARQTTPDLTLNDQLGGTISLDTLRGKIVLLDFWGVWCGPCRQKLPKTQDIYEEFKDKPLAVIGIHSAERTEGMADFIAQNNITFPVGIDPGHIADDYSVNAWPTYYLIDKQGRIAWGPQHGLPSKGQIQSLLKE